MSATAGSWQEQLLTLIGAPVTDANQQFLTAWNMAEGNLNGHSGLGINNPMNTTNVGPGSVPVNSAGVQMFPTLNEGLLVTARTITANNGSAGWTDYYSSIRDALRTGDPLNHVTDTLKQELGTWGTGSGFLGNVTTMTTTGTTTSGSTKTSTLTPIQGTFTQTGPGGTGFIAKSPCQAPTLPLSLNPIDWVGVGPKAATGSANPFDYIGYYLCVITYDIQRGIFMFIAIVIVILGIYIFGHDKDAPDVVKVPVKEVDKAGKKVAGTAAEAGVAAAAA